MEIKVTIIAVKTSFNSFFGFLILDFIFIKNYKIANIIQIKVVIKCEFATPKKPIAKI